ncbi:MAG: general secretion pathway protein GspB [Gammaproteobacteria bacterium]|nr:general secretion pathway protein GspB [Gammaproteobacteria bacterium]
MSYILDALRKSQQARQPATPERTGAVHNVSLSLPVSGWWLVLGIVLLLGLVIAMWAIWRGSVGNLPDPPAEPVQGEPVAVTPAAAPTGSANIGPASNPPAVPARETSPVSDLAEQAKVPVPAPPPKKIIPERVENKTVTIRQPDPGTDAVAATAMPLATDNTPLLQQMPQDFQRALPSLAVTIHVYSRDESQQILFINNREYRKGSQIETGLRVEDIVPDGVVLSFRGERFKLSRPR